MERHLIIRWNRERRGITQVGLAKAVGVSKGMVGQWETQEGNEKSIGLGNLWKLATTLQVPMGDLLREGDGGGSIPFELADFDEIALVCLFRLMDADQKDIHLRLFYSATGVAQPPQQNSSPDGRLRIASGGTGQETTDPA